MTAPHHFIISQHPGLTSLCLQDILWNIHFCAEEWGELNSLQNHVRLSLFFSSVYHRLHFLILGQTVGAKIKNKIKNRGRTHNPSIIAIEPENNKTRLINQRRR